MLIPLVTRWCIAVFVNPIIDDALQSGEVVFDGPPSRVCEPKSRSWVLADVPFGHLNVCAGLEFSDLLGQCGLCHASGITHKREVRPITRCEYCEDLEPCGIGQEWINLHGFTPGWRRDGTTIARNVAQQMTAQGP
jgi:hypothetical protein